MKKMKCTTPFLSNSTRLFVRLLGASVLLIVVLAGCATVQPPNGGPEDKTPPEIDTTGIVNGITNFHAKTIGIHFSEYVEKSKVLENLILSPERPMEYSWSGRDLEISFPQGLDTNTTYALTVGTDYTDLHGNKPREAYTLVFSTGNHLDSAAIIGEVHDANPAGVFVELYPLSGINADTLNPSTTKARYRTQVGSSGAFAFRALPYGSYRIIALRDVTKDGLYTIGTDAFGTSIDALQLNSSQAQKVVLRLDPTPDLSPLQLSEARSKSQNRIDLLCSEAVDTASVHAASFILSDSSGRTTTKVLAAYVSTVSPSVISLETENRTTASLMRLRVTASKDGPTDLNSNHLVDSNSTLFFQSSTEIDTTNPQVLSISMRDSSQSVGLQPMIKVVFSRAMQRDSLENHMSFIKQNQRLSTVCEWLADNIVRVYPRDSLESDAWYELRFRTNGLQSATRRFIRDSTMRIRMKTFDTKNFGSIRGVLIDSSAKDGTPYFITLKSKSTQTRTLKLDKPGAFTFSLLAEGEYTIEAYCDEDHNGRYTSGRAVPFMFAERIVESASPVALKARWTVDDLRLIIPKRKP